MSEADLTLTGSVEASSPHGGGLAAPGSCAGRGSLTLHFPDTCAQVSWTGRGWDSSSGLKQAPPPLRPPPSTSTLGVLWGEGSVRDSSIQKKPREYLKD